MEQGKSSSSTSNSGERLEVTVGGDEGSPRLDRVLAVLRPELSRSRLKALILAGSVTVRDTPIRDPAYHVAKGDTITIDVPEAAPPEPKGARIVSTGTAGERLVVTLDIGGVTEIRTFDAKTLKPAGKLKFVSEP